MSEKKKGEVSEELREAMRDAAKDGRIACARALALASEHGVPSRRIGALADELSLKIVACQLGCFK